MVLGEHRPLLVAGVPRSGSSWIGKTLGRGDGTAYVHEPDNEKRDAYALRAKARLGRFPVLEADDAAAAYERLWRGAFAGGAISQSPLHRLALSQLSALTQDDLERAASGRGRAPRLRVAAAAARPRTAAPGSRRVVVKTVHAPLALRWIRSRFDVDLVVVLRHPLNVLASMLDLEMPDRDRGLDRVPRVVHDHARRWGVDPPAPGASALTRAAWQVGLLQSALAEHSGAAVAVVVHEELCTDAVSGFRSLFEKASVPWSDGVAAHVRASDRPGGGYKTNRVAADQPERWRRRFDAGAVAEIRDALAPFPVPGWPRDGSGP